MRTNRSVHLALAMTLGLALAGCAAGGQQDAATGLVIWADETRGDVLKPFAEKFGERNGIEVSVEVHSNDKLQDDFVTASEQGEGPDVLVAAHDWIGNLVRNSSIGPGAARQKQPRGLRSRRLGSRHLRRQGVRHSLCA